MSAQMTKDDVLKEMRALGKVIKTDLEAKHETSIDRVRSLEASLKKQESAIQKFAEALEKKEGLAIRPGQSVDERVDEIRSKFAQRRGGGRQMFGAGIGRAAVVGSTRGILAARVMRVLALSLKETGSQSRMHDHAINTAKSWGDDMLLDALESNKARYDGVQDADTGVRAASVRALGTDQIGSGGAFIESELSSEFIDILHARTVVRNAGALSLPMPTGDMAVPFLDEGAVASYKGENIGQNATTVSTGRLNWKRRTLMALIPFSNEWLTEASYAVDAILSNHLAMQLTKREDLVFIRGDGLLNTPLGMSYWADVAGNAKDTAGVTIANITADIAAMVSAIEGGNVPMTSPGWAMSVREKYGLYKLRDGNNNLVFGDEMRAGTLWSFPYYATSQIPTNLDVSGTGDDDESEVYFADFASAAIAEVSGIEVEMLPDAAYRDASGNLQSGASNNQSILRATARHDFAMLHRGKDVYRLDEVTWGV